MLLPCNRERWGALCPCTPRVQLEQSHTPCLLLGEALWTWYMLCPAGTVHLPHHGRGDTLRRAWLDQPHPGLEQRDTARGCADTAVGPGGDSPVGGHHLITPPWHQCNTEEVLELRGRSGHSPPGDTHSHLGLVTGSH